MATIGYSSIAANNHAPTGYWNATWYQANSSGTLTQAKICCWDANATRWVKVAIYTNAGTSPPGSGSYPGTLVGNNQATITQTTKPTQDSEWTSMNIAGTITQNSYYWLCFMFQGYGDEYAAWEGAAAWASVRQSYDPDTFPPGTAPSANWVQYDYRYSLYANYTEAGGGEPMYLTWTR